MLPLEILIRWEKRDPALADDAARLARFVSGLPSFDPIYLSWLRSPKTKKPVLTVPLSEAEARAVLEKSVCRGDVENTPMPEFGSFVSAGHAGAPPYDFRGSSYADTTCTIGSRAVHGPIDQNLIVMRLSKIRPSTGHGWRASELRPLLKFTREVWNPTEMLAMCSDFTMSLPKKPNPVWPGKLRPLRPWLGWITYLPPDLAARAKYPDFVEVETLDDGAVLVTICEEPFGKDDEAGVAKLTALQEALRPIQA